MAKKTKQTSSKPNYVGVRTYVKDARSPRIARIKNALSLRDGKDLNVRDTNDLVMERGAVEYEKELNLV